VTDVAGRLAASTAMLQPIVALLAGILILLISTNLEFHRRYLSDIRRRDGFMASPSIRPSALNVPTGKCGRMTADPRFTPASPLDTNVTTTARWVCCA
jgi:hypothetical protein